MFKRMLVIAACLFVFAPVAAFAEFADELATGSVEVNPNDFYACRVLNVSGDPLHAQLVVQNQDAQELATETVWVDPWKGEELVFNVPSTPIANRTLACKIRLDDTSQARANATVDQGVGPTKLTIDAGQRQTTDRTFFKTLEFGETWRIIEHGPLALDAVCETGIEDPEGDPDSEDLIDRVRILAVTTVPGAVADLDSGDFPTSGGVFLNPSTLADDRVFSDEEAPVGDPEYNNDIDDGSVIAPTGHVIFMDGEILGLGLNIFGVDCLVTGVTRTFRGTLPALP